MGGRQRDKVVKNFIEKRNGTERNGKEIEIPFPLYLSASLPFYLLTIPFRSERQ